MVVTRFIIKDFTSWPILCQRKIVRDPRATRIWKMRIHLVLRTLKVKLVMIKIWKWGKIRRVYLNCYKRPYVEQLSGYLGGSSVYSFVFDPPCYRRFWCQDKIRKQTQLCTGILQRGTFVTERWAQYWTWCNSILSYVVFQRIFFKVGCSPFRCSYDSFY